MKYHHFVLTALSVLIPLSGIQAATVKWGARNSNLLGDLFGTLLPANSLLKIGTFTISDSQIRATAIPTLLDQSFILFDTATISSPPGSFQKNSSFNANPNLNLKRIYIWAFNSSLEATATQQAIFTSSLANWVFPDDNAIPPTTSVDLSNLTNYDSTDTNHTTGFQTVPSADIVFGSFGTGSSNGGGAFPVSYPLFNTALIPEPSTYFLLVVGAGVLAIFRFTGTKRKAS